jgi:hypothetical protein
VRLGDVEPTIGASVLRVVVSTVLTSDTVAAPGRACLGSSHPRHARGHEPSKSAWVRARTTVRSTSLAASITHRSSSSTIRSVTPWRASGRRAPRVRCSSAPPRARVGSSTSDPMRRTWQPSAGVSRTLGGRSATGRRDPRWNARSPISCGVAMVVVVLGFAGGAGWPRTSSGSEPPSTWPASPCSVHAAVAPVDGRLWGADRAEFVTRPRSGPQHAPDGPSRPLGGPSPQFPAADRARGAGPLNHLRAPSPAR